MGDPFAYQEWLVKEEKNNKAAAQRMAEGHAACGTRLELPPWDPSGDIALGAPGMGLKHSMHLSRSASMPSIVATLLSNDGCRAAKGVCDTMRASQSMRFTQTLAGNPRAEPSRHAPKLPWATSDPPCYQTIQRDSFRGKTRIGEGLSPSSRPASHSRASVASAFDEFGLKSSLTSPWAACTGMTIDTESRRQYRGRSNKQPSPLDDGGASAHDAAHAIRAPYIDIMSNDKRSSTVYHPMAPEQRGARGEHAKTGGTWKRSQTQHF
mmetsp:Transcript_90295/g.229613  ORF Transcript_90295/g.229613 Transcript_90295/m.229613 type:complete len:266 (+) Transcript_90295:37-834(+)